MDTYPYNFLSIKFFTILNCFNVSQVQPFSFMHLLPSIVKYFTFPLLGTENNSIPGSLLVRQSHITHSGQQVVKKTHITKPSFFFFFLCEPMHSPQASLSLLQNLAKVWMVKVPLPFTMLRMWMAWSRATYCP